MSTVRITHIGGPTVLLEIEGWRILTDPTFDAPGRTYKFGWGSSSTKMTGPALPATELAPIDAVVLTHDHHGDNLDDAGRALLPSAGVVVTTESGSGRLGGATRGLAPWATTALEAPGRPRIEVTATPCRHGPPLSRPIVGDVVGFSLQWEGQQDGTLWISGDTVLYGGMGDVAERLDVGVAILHLGAARFSVTGPVRYTMNTKNAIDLCRVARPRTVIPVHYEGWSHFREGRGAIERELATAPDDISRRFRLVPIGEAVEIPA